MRILGCFPYSHWLSLYLFSQAFGLVGYGLVEAFAQAYASSAVAMASAVMTQQMIAGIMVYAHPSAIARE